MQADSGSVRETFLLLMVPQGLFNPTTRENGVGYATVVPGSIGAEATVSVGVTTVAASNS